MELGSTVERYAVMLRGESPQDCCILVDCHPGNQGSNTFPWARLPVWLLGVDFTG